MAAALTALREAGLHVSVTPAGRLAVTPASKLTPELRQIIGTHRLALLQQLGGHRAAANDPPPPTPSATTPSKAEVHPSLLTAATSEEIDLMGRRLVLFARHGLNVIEADRLADKLLVRDREADRRSVCAECQHLSGRGSGRWKCASTDTRNELGGVFVSGVLVHQQLHFCQSLQPSLCQPADPNIQVESKP